MFEIVTLKTYEGKHHIIAWQHQEPTRGLGSWIYSDIYLSSFVIFFQLQSTYGYMGIQGYGSIQTWLDKHEINLAVKIFNIPERLRLIFISK